MPLYIMRVRESCVRWWYLSNSAVLADERPGKPWRDLLLCYQKYEIS